MPFTAGPHPGVLHHYATRLVAFEHRPTSNPSATQATSFVLFFGGLTDSLMTVRYPSVLATLLPPTWAVAEVQLSSSNTGWATSTLARDADEAARAVAYFRAQAAHRDPAAPARIVLLGHSTGAQITASYLIGPWREARVPPAVLARPRVDGLVLQAGISDREGATEVLSAADVAGALALARRWIGEGRGGDVLPLAATKDVYGGGVNPTAERWISLMDPVGEDDLFSSDLGDERVARVWGGGGLAGRKVPVLVMLGGADEHMPKFVDREALVKRWEEAVKKDGGIWLEQSGVVPGAGHNLNKSDEAVVQDLCGRIVALVTRLNGSGTGERL